MITILYIILAYLIITFGLVGIGLFFKKDLGYKTFKDGTVIQNYELPDWLNKRGWYWKLYKRCSGNKHRFPQTSNTSKF